MLLLEELNISEEFAKWVYSVVTKSDVAPAIKGAWHSISDQPLGESDLVAIYADGCAILIENKIDATAQSDQGKRYKQRGIRGIEKGLWNSFNTCLIAPRVYLEKEQDASIYDTTVSYEEISEWFISKSDSRSKYRSYLINEAIEQSRRGYTMVPNDAVTDFWAKYWNLVIQLYPELNMKKPGLKPAKADWPYFRPSTLQKRFCIVHKLERGCVDFQIAGKSEKISELREQLSNFNMEIVKAGKSAAVRFRVSPIDRFVPFDAQKVAVVEGINAAKTMLKIGEEIQKKNLTIVDAEE